MGVSSVVAIMYSPIECRALFFSVSLVEALMTIDRMLASTLREFVNTYAFVSRYMSCCLLNLYTDTHPGPILGFVNAADVGRVRALPSSGGGPN